MLSDLEKIKRSLECVVDYLKTVDDIAHSEVRYIFRMDSYQIWIYKGQLKAPLTFTEEELCESGPEQVKESVIELVRRFKND